jgi:methylmalonyl-CoA epimerase
MSESPRINHTGIAVRDLDVAVRTYIEALGASLSDRVDVPDQGVAVAFLTLGDTQIELVQPLSTDSAVARFLERRGEGLHHICVQVDDVRGELDRLASQGHELIDREPRHGAHGLVAFVHPRSAHGVLLELLERE